VLLDFNASNDPSLESCAPGVDPTRGLCGISDLQGYSDEIAAVVRHTRGVIDDFEVVNEPDAGWAFSGTPQQYAGMLTTAYAAVHDNDPAGRVVLGGIMTPSNTSWLAAVFTTPGVNAAHAFDIANVHLRDTVANVTGQLLAWRKFFTFFGDGGLPLWVTETGYPADPAYQYDPAFRGTDAATGAAAQAAYLAKEIPALLFVGATRIFVTERDTAGAQYASEGLLGGQVTDADENDPAPQPRPAYTVFSELAATLTASPPTPVAPPPPPPPPPASPPASVGGPRVPTTATVATKTGPAKSTARPKPKSKPKHTPTRRRRPPIRRGRVPVKRAHRS
jgi:hypothetical protein